MVYTATDKEQIEALKKGWHAYGKSIALAVLLGLLIGGGWRYWQAYVSAKEQAASQIYQSMLQAAASQQTDIVTHYVAQLQQQYGKTVYASLGSFVAAQMNVAAANYAAADANLKWVIHHSHQDALKKIAHLRDARVLLQMRGE